MLRSTPCAATAWTRRHDRPRRRPRLGIYFLEKGASQRASKVLYDRAGLRPSRWPRRSDFDWDAIFDGADWFHFTGITPALGDELPEICLDALQGREGEGTDRQLRPQLPQASSGRVERAGEVMGRLMPYVDVCIANEEDAKDVFGIQAARIPTSSGGKLDRDGYIGRGAPADRRASASRYVAITLRTSISASDNNWSRHALRRRNGLLRSGNTTHPHRRPRGRRRQLRRRA